MEQLFEVLLNAAVVLVGALATYLSARLGIWLKSKIKNEKLQNLVDHVLGFSEDIVITINETFVKELKATGKFDLDSQQAALSKALDLAKSMISEEGKKLLESEFGDVETWLIVIIESKVEEVKQKLLP